MFVSDILYSQGFGSRRHCQALVDAGEVLVGGRVLEDPFEELSIEGLTLHVQGKTWPYHAKAYLAMNKPSGYECSQKPKQWPSVYSLLPEPLRMRPVKGGTDGVQAVGRLDQDTTGLLLFSDDGQFLHKMTSPKKLVPKVYRVGTAEAVTDQQLAKLLSGVELHDDRETVAASACECVEPNTLLLTLTQGKYHQVKRMLAAVGNHVQSLQREAIGAYRLPLDLAPGQWTWLGAEQLGQLVAPRQ